MTINRNNYEEFFLLYVDNELTTHEKTAVEKFISVNPDLAKELKTLQQARLGGGHTITFANKELLYKKDSSISLANYEEYFLMAADDELNEQQSSEVEGFVLKHPQLQNEFTLLQQVKLKPEPIRFKEKKKLYRSEKERRLIPAVWLRISAAAAIISIIMTTFVISNKTKPVAINKKTNTENNQNNTNLSKLNNTVISEKNNEPLAKTTATKKRSGTLPVKPGKKVEFKSVAAVNYKTKKVVSQKVEQSKSSDKSVAEIRQKVGKKPGQIIKADSLPAERPAVAQQKLPSAQSKTSSSDGSNSSKTTNVHPRSEPDFTYTKQSVLEEQPLITSHAVYLETDNDEEEKTVYVGSAEINKNKLKGFFKKVSTFIDKKIRQKKD